MPFHKMLLTSFLLLFSIAITHAQVDSASNTGAFTRVDQEASFPGGGQGWIKYLQKNLNADVPVKNDAPAGKYTVIVKFVVNKDGTISDIRAETKVGYGMEEEVVRIIEKSGKWEPAMIGNKPVNAYRRQPVVFMTTEDGFDIICQEPYTLFTGIDNEITIQVEKIKGEDLSATISKGTITPKGDGKFIVRVPKTDRVTIEVFNKKKNDKLLGTASLEVKGAK